MENKDWEGMVRLASSIRDTVDFGKDDTFSIIEDYCYHPQNYIGITSFVNIEVMPEHRKLATVALIEEIVTCMILDYTATMYGIVFGHNRHRDGAGESDNHKLMKLGVKNGNIEIDDTNTIKVKFISEVKSRGKKKNSEKAAGVKRKSSRECNYKVGSWPVAEQTRHYKSGKVVVVAPFTKHRRLGDVSKISGVVKTTTFEIKDKE